ncbi:MAG: NAD-dependent epimerase/dehydratase family protein [Gemmatimonadetes bacterium]|nr:MAG: NAD-dependent epimerase/dehydratase family protein [Gemmatimonadota bacterium]
MNNILITGGNGQIGSELYTVLSERYGIGNIVSLDIQPPRMFGSRREVEHYEIVDVTDYKALRNTIKKYQIDTVFHLASLLSATGELKPDLAWNVNMNGLKNVLDLARDYQLQVFWPSSIAAFGPHSPQINTPQFTVLDPNTMYGVTKVAGELLCNYYFEKYNVDVRSLRYPGLISYKTPPGGGTTDYAVEIFYEAIKHKKYNCFVSAETRLPMMYMPDAIKATLDIMHAPAEQIKIRTSYNLAAISFSAEELANEIKKHIPEFECTYEPDFHQAIADSWPKSIDDSRAREDWGWSHEYDLAAMTADMLEKLA